MILSTCKEIAAVRLGMVNQKCAAAAYRAGGQGFPYGPITASENRLRAFSIALNRHCEERSDEAIQ